MSTIVAGRFDRSVDADAALEALKRNGFMRDEVDSFYVGPPGQNARTPIGGDTYSDAGSAAAGRHGAIGAFAGVMAALHGASPREATPEHPVERRGGRMIAVRVDRQGTERLAVEALRSNHARDVGRTEGQWRNGWSDLDPRTPIATV